MTDLKTRYLGLELRNPVVASASPLCGDVDNVRRMAEAGAAAVVLPSIFEEQIEAEQQAVEQLTRTGSDTYAEALSYFPSTASYPLGSGHYIDFVQHAVRAVDIPVVASLNGISDHGWINYARQIEQAGASALELNIYFIPTDAERTGREVEQRYVDIVHAVKQVVRIPVAVKLGPYFSAFGHMAGQLVQAGADGLVLFNRFYEPDIDPASLSLAPDLELSSPYEIRLPLLWIGVLSGRLKTSLAASSGVDSADDVIKYLLAGADVVMTTSALLRHGIAHLEVLLRGLEFWLAARKLESLDEVRGRMSHRNVANPEAFERANYIKTLQTGSWQARRR